MVTSAAHEQVRLAAAVVTYRASPVVQTLERVRQTSTSKSEFLHVRRLSSPPPYGRVLEAAYRSARRTYPATAASAPPSRKYRANLLSANARRSSFADHRPCSNSCSNTARHDAPFLTWERPRINAPAPSSSQPARIKRTESTEKVILNPNPTRRHAKSQPHKPPRLHLRH